MEEHKQQVNTQQLEKIDLIHLLGEFWDRFRRLFWLPLLLAALGAAALGGRAYLRYSPSYASEATFTIQTMESLYDITGMNSYYDKAAAEQLAMTFPYLLQSDLMQSMLRQELGVSWLNGSISAQAVENTNLFSLRVTSSDPQAAYDILNAIIRVYPKVADYVIGSTEMVILAEPTLATQPYNAFSPTSSLVKGGMLGLALGLLVILALALARRTIHSREEIKRRLNVPCIGVLPAVSFKRRSGAFDRSVCVRNPKVPSDFLEGVRSLRIRFLREAEKTGDKVYLVSSTAPGEGKTTVAVNLAFTLSQNGMRVILVDMDLRNPSVKRNLGITEPSKGVGELIQERNADPLPALLQVEGSGVRLLAGDKAISTPRRQLESRRLSRLIQALREEADFIILDSPPNGLLGDSAVLAELADGVVYVVRSGAVHVNHIIDSIQFLSGSRTPLLGCVLNGAKGGSRGYGYGYGYKGYRSYRHKGEAEQ